MARAAAVPLDGLFPGVGASASDLFGVASFARFATGGSKGKERGKKEERNPRSGLRPSLRTEPGGEQPEAQYQKDDTKGTGRPTGRWISLAVITVSLGGSAG